MDFLFDDLQKMILRTIIICGLMSLVVHVYKNNQWVKCQKQRMKLKRQGIKGPSSSLLYGNHPEMQRIQSMVANKSLFNAEIVGHDYTSVVFPYFEHWRKQYGTIYTYSTGNRQYLYVNDPEMVKEISQNMSFELGKPPYITKPLAPLLGNGILTSNGHAWAKQRKIVAPPFFMDKVKTMVGFMKEATQSMLAKWEDYIEVQGGQIAEIRVDEDLRTAVGDVISKACFGTSNYHKGNHIILKIRTLQTLLSNQNFLFRVPSLRRILNTKVENEVKLLEKEIETLIWEAVQESSKCSSEKDLMQWIMDGAINDQDFGKDSSKQLIVDNCKNIYFAGQESTAVVASWCLMLLALHPEWQDHIREEVAHICNGSHDYDQFLNADSLLKIKSVTMVIQETLRLYPPSAFKSREALEEFQLGSIKVPKGVCIWTSIPTLHRDPNIWGDDANEFKPQRFANGVSNATKYPHAYLPFGLGNRMCIGKHFAMVELMLLLCLIVSKFSFSLSPNYRHSPTYRLIVEPGNGVHILIKRI